MVLQFFNQVLLDVGLLKCIYSGPINFTKLIFLKDFLKECEFKINLNSKQDPDNMKHWEKLIHTKIKSWFLSGCLIESAPEATHAEHAMAIA